MAKNEELNELLEWCYHILVDFFKYHDNPNERTQTMSTALCDPYYKCMKKLSLDSDVIEQKYIDMLKKLYNYLVYNANNPENDMLNADLRDPKRIDSYKQLIDSIELNQLYGHSNPTKTSNKSINNTPEEDSLVKDYDMILPYFNHEHSVERKANTKAKLDEIEKFYYLISHDYIKNVDEYLSSHGYIPANGKMLISTNIADELLKRYGLSIFSFTEEEVSNFMAHFYDVPRIVIDDANLDFSGEVRFTEYLVDAFKLEEAIAKKLKVRNSKKFKKGFIHTLAKKLDKFKSIVHYQQRKGKKRK